MKRHVMVMADPDRCYLEALTAYVNTAMTALSVEIRAVSRVSEIRETLKASDVPVAVISESFLPEAGEVLNEAQSGGVTTVILTEGIHKSPCEGMAAVSKYQAVPEMMQRILRIYAGRTQGEPRPVIKADMLVIGVFSPAGRCLKSSLALAIGQIYAESRPALLLDLESQAAYPAWFDRAYVRDLSDLAAAVMEKKPHLMAFLSACVQKVGALDYVPPFAVGLEAPRVPAEVWQTLIGQIRENSAYEVLIIDAGSSICGLGRLLKSCDRVLMPVPDDEAAREKIDDYLKTMDLWDPELKERFTAVDIGPLPVCGLGVEKPADLPAGPVGALARYVIGQEA